MDCSMPGLPVHHQSPESTQTHVHWVGDAIQLSHPLLSPFSPALNLSQHQGLFKYFYWNFSFNFTPSNEHAGLIFFRMDWLDLPVVQGTFKSLLQYHSSKALIHWHSAFFLYFFSFLKPGLLFFKNWTIWTLHTLTKLGLCLLYGLQTFPTLCLSPLKCLNIFHNKKHACSLSIFSFMLSEFCDLLGRDFALDYKMISSCFFCFFNFFKFYFTILYWFCHISI